MRSEFNKSFYNSSLQMFLLAIIVYGFTCFAGPVMACGVENTNVDYKVFQCANGEMLFAHKLMLFAGIALASLCAGRAMSLIQKSASQ